MLNVLEHALNHPFKTKSNFARDNADLIAAAASEGFITTKIAPGQYTRQWVLTPLGLSHLYVLKGTHHQ
jgi:hypothetical protein